MVIRTYIVLVLSPCLLSEQSFKPCSDERHNGFKSLKLKRLGSYSHLLLHVNVIVFVLRY